jgi:uncharacterized delta-60 repeat protein
VAQSTDLDHDGNLLIGGYSYNVNNYDFSVARVNTNGSLDNTFSNDGKHLINGNDALLIPVEKNNQARSLVTDSTGRLLVAGFSYNGGDNDFCIARLNANGSLDNTFGGNGKLIIPVGNGDDEGKCLAMDADGKILIAGSSVNDNQKVFSLVRLNSDGNLDTSFDIDGKVLISLSDNDSYGANSLFIDSFGKVLLVGSSENHYSILRLNSDGSLDNTFDGDGKKVITDGLSGYATCAAIDTNNKILLAGRSIACSGHECGWENFQVVRLNMDGSYDTTFDGDGKLMLYFDNPQLINYINYATSIGIDHIGRILISGSTARHNSVWNNYDWGPGITRLNSDGSLDTTFKVNGKPLIPAIEDIFANIENMSHSQTLLPDGKILIAGCFQGDFGVLRLNYDGSPDSTFGNNGITKPTYGQGNAMMSDSNYIWMAGTADSDFKIIKLYARNNQHIDFALPDTVRYTDAPVKLDATASSGLPVTYMSSDPAIASISHDTLIITGPGTVAITARQNGDGSFYAAQPLVRAVKVVDNTITKIIAYDKDYTLTTYPVPVYDKLYVTCDIGLESVTMTDILGEIRYQNVHVNGKNLEIDMTEFKPGYYVLIIRHVKSDTPGIIKILKI